MNTDIHSLQLLERDLEEVAASERERIASVDQALDGGAGGPRRLPRRGRGGGHAWGGIAAALVAVLVLAGGIGFLSQGGGDDEATSGAGDSGSFQEVGGAVSGGGTGSKADLPQATPAPAPGTERGNLSEEAAFEGFAADQAAPGVGSGGRNLQGIGAVPEQQGDLTKIIRDGRIGIVIADGSFSKGVAGVTQIARRNGGFVLESSSRDERSGALTLRVPAKRFDDTMLALRALSGQLDGEVEFQDITGQDVTAEFIDLQARLDILKDRRELLLDIQADATSTSEILRLAALIDDVQLQIENIQGRLNFLKDQVAEATIKVEVRERDVQREDPGPDPENPSLTESFELAVQGFLRIVGAVVVGLGYLIPLGVIALIGWGVVRLVRRRDRGAS
ncbi:MAG TPA: DUF4349 domain-containing protein [Actinomycetota bacterium]|nr:DUF4349 domain-containing protein [Actinomycetota bacterium]